MNRQSISVLCYLLLFPLLIIAQKNGSGNKSPDDSRLPDVFTPWLVFVLHQPLAFR